MKQLLRRILAATTIATTLLLVAFAVAFGSTAIAQVSMNGKIYTSNSDGTTVNGNIYATKDQVYVNGGPQHEQQNGISPDGTYYFQVTDPSGAVLLSSDDITCRQLVVSGGRVVGIPLGSPPATCTTGYHAIGVPDPSSGQTPVQLIPYADTPNPGGEYKVWATPVQDYVGVGGSCPNGNNRQGFCDNNSATDNFKVRKPGVADITVCKFNDENNNTFQDFGEPLLAHWPITAKGVDGDAGNGVLVQTDDFGCVSFSVSTFPQNNIVTVTLTEGTQGPDWTQTAPQDGPCTLTGTFNSADTCSVSGGVITLTVSPDDDVNAPNFGNFNPNCATDCTGSTLVVTKSANTSLTRTYTWGITKSVDNSQINTSGSATFNYTVNVTHDAGTDSAWQVTGTIRVSNPTGSDISAIEVTDSLDAGSNGVCTVTGGTGLTVPAGSHEDLPYTCTFSTAPNPTAGTNTATAAWTNGPTVATHSYDFGAATINVVDGSVNVTDTLGGSLGTVTYTDPSPKTFTYPETFTDRAGTCTAHPNTATFIATDNPNVTGSDSKSVRVCVGADLTVSKTATGAFTSSISKAVDNSRINTYSGGSATFNYTVTVTESGWNVTGTITVTNPNDWEAVTVNLSDGNLSGATCTITGGNVQTVPISSSITPAYSCTFSGVPSAATGTNTATGTWDKTAYFTPDGSATGSHDFSFVPLTVTDTYKGTLGTISVPTASSTFTYARIETAPNHTCATLPNTATITQTTQSSSQSVMLCGASDLTVVKTAAGAFNSNITKAVDKTIVEQAGGSATFNYTVTVTESGWNVSGIITVTNPNDWEAITANVGDTLSGGSCTVTGGTGASVPASNSVPLPYTCTFSARPSYTSGTNTATASWSGAFTPHNSATGSYGFSFATLTIQDAFNGGSPCTLGTVSVTITTPSSGCGVTVTSPSWGVLKYARTIANSPPGTCKAYSNTANDGVTPSNQVTVNVCNTNTGALTMGFWKNSNGQRIITNYCAPAGGTSLGAFLTSLNPFKDDTATTCSGQASYVSRIIGAATCSGSTCNPMLKAQMLATALDVYFSTQVNMGGGGNVIGAYNGLGGNTPPLGGVVINLSHICSMTDSSSGTGTCSGSYEDARYEFGIVTTGGCLGTTVAQMLFYADASSSVNGNPVSNAGGGTWYNQVKNPKQVYAKDSFDATNNQVANIATSSCSPTF